MTASHETMVRAQIVTEARSWVGTPYHRRAMVKGAGADCATLIFAVFRSAGLVPDEKIGMFGDDWWAHTESEHYMERLLRHASKVVEAVGYADAGHTAGNVALLKAAGSRVWNHGAIITRWPLCVHAIRPRIAEVDITTDPMWSFQTIAVFDVVKGNHAR